MANHVYNSELDSEFKDTWKLNNLRPLRSKDNIVLGARMNRTKKNYNTAEVV